MRKIIHYKNNGRLPSGPQPPHHQTHHPDSEVGEAASQVARRRLTRSPWLPPQQRGTQAEHREGHDRKKTKHHHRRHHRQHAIISIIKMMVLRDGAIKFRKLYDKVTTIFKAVFTTKTSGDALTDEMYNFAKLLRRKHSRDLTDEERGYIADLTSVKNRIKQLEVQTSRCYRR